MKKLYTLLIFQSLLSVSFGQTLSLKDLVNSASCPTDAFSSYISKKGFRAEDEAFRYAKKKEKAVNTASFLKREDEPDRQVLHYQTLSEEDSKALKEQLQQQGFQRTTNSGDVYQKGIYTVRYSETKDGDATKHYFVVEKKQLPPPNYYFYAEDLLQLTSHEYLAAVFGAQHVKKETFYYSEKDTNACSVLFPNTNMQVIFIWKDETNYQDISFLIVGGELKAGSSTHTTVAQNKWKSKQGVYLGMSLQELQRANEQPLSFYNWNRDEAGLVNSQHEGRLDLRQLGIVLSHLDLSPGSIEEVVHSSDALKKNERIYVSTLIILPGGK